MDRNDGAGEEPSARVIDVLDAHAFAIDSLLGPLVRQATDMDLTPEESAVYLVGLWMIIDKAQAALESQLKAKGLADEETLVQERAFSRGLATPPDTSLN